MGISEEIDDATIAIKNNDANYCRISQGFFLKKTNLNNYCLWYINSGGCRPAVYKEGAQKTAAERFFRQIPWRKTDDIEDWRYP